MLRLILTFTLLSFLTIQPAHSREHIRIVGSSTVYPFITVAAEQFGNNSGSYTPIVESTGTGGGFKLFCSGVGTDHPDISNASRAIKPSEVALCKENGIEDITEINLGYDGIVLANSLDRPQFTLTKKQIFLALAKKIAIDGTLVENPYKQWSDIDKTLPNKPIRVYGPPPTSGTRDAFVELVMEADCIHDPVFKDTFPNKKNRAKACHLIREDGAYIEAGENDNMIIQKLIQNPDSLGVFGFSFLEQNSHSVQGSIIESVEPTFDTIADGSYTISRPLYIYVKNNHIPLINDLKPFLQEVVSDAAMGEDGYMAEKGLITLYEDDLASLQETINNL